MKKTHESDAEVIPLVEEEFRVEKREVPGGKVRIRTVTDAFEKVARATLEEEKVEITRVQVGEIVDKAPVVRTEGDVIIVPVLEEVIFVEKRLVLVEEMHIRRIRGTQEVEVPVTLRKQRAIIEKIAPEPTPPANKETSE